MRLERPLQGCKYREVEPPEIVYERKRLVVRPFAVSDSTANAVAGSLDLTPAIGLDRRVWPRQESNLRTRIRRPRAEARICRRKPVDVKAARHCARHSCD